MIKKLIFVVACLCSAAYGQSVTITGQVLDPTGKIYVNGSGVVNLVPGNQTWTINGTNPVNSPVPIAALDSFGRFTVTLTNTSLIQPSTANPQWQFSFCSNAALTGGSAICFTMTPMALTSSQSISSQIQAQSALLPVTGGGNFYQTIEVGGVSVTQRPIQNLIPGTNISISCVDNSGQTRTDCTISSTGGGSGNVTGPGSSAIGHVALFNNLTGTLISDSGVSFPLPNTNLLNNTITINNGSGISGGGTVALGGSLTLTASAASNYQTIASNGTSQTQQPTLNLIPGTNMTIPCVNNAGLNRTDCTFNSSGGGSPGGSVGAIQFNNTTFGGSAAIISQSGQIANASALNGITINSSTYNWSTTATVSSGVNVITLTPCPAGLTATTSAPPAVYIYVSGVGTPEADLISSTTCTQAGGASGTITFTASNAHGAGTTLGSASQGAQEAINAASYVSNVSSFNELGYTLVPPATYNWYATVNISSPDMVVDFAGSVVTCKMATTCLLVGNTTNQTFVWDATVKNFKGQPGCVGCTAPMIEDAAQKTHFFEIGTANPNPINSGYTFGSLIQIDNDQAAIIDGLSTYQALWYTCTTSFCSTAVKGSGGSNAGVIYIKNSNLNLNCGSNGVDNQNGNTLRISDSVIQGQAQFAVRSVGVYSNVPNVELDNVYGEVANCAGHNPLGIGEAGLIVEGGYASVKSSVGPVGSSPVFANTGSTQYNYYIAAHSGTYGYAPPLLIGIALTSGTGTIPVAWPQFGTSGTITYDVIRTSGQANNPAPYTAICAGGTTTTCGSVATGLTVGSACSTVGTANICTFNDTASTNTASYTVTSPSTYWPALGNGTGAGVFWPGSVIYTISSDAPTSGPTPGGVYFDRYGDNIANSAVNPVSQTVSSFGALTPKFYALDCNSTYGGGWLSCLNHTQGTQAGATLMNAGAYNGPDVSGAKGRLNFEEGLDGVIAGGHKITLVDSNPAKTLNTGGMRPTYDANDTYIGLDNAGTAGAASAQLAFGAPVSISDYIGNAGNNTSYLSRLTATLQTFTVPVTAPSMNATTGFQINGLAPSGHCLIGNSTYYVDSSSCGGGGLPSGTQGLTARNTTGSTTYAATSLAGGIDASVFLTGSAGTCTPGTNDDACIANAIASIPGTPGSTGGYAIVDATGIGNQVWATNPFASFLSNGTTNITAPKKCGKLLLSGGSQITMNQPLTVPRCWSVEVVSQFGQSPNIIASSTWPGIYTAGTVTNTAATMISSGQYQFTVTGIGTAFTNAMLYSEFGVCQGTNNPGANGPACGGNGTTTCSSACGGNGVGLLTYGMIIAVNTGSQTLTVATANANAGAANGSGVNYVIKAPLIWLGAMGADGGDSGGASATWTGGTISCNNKPGCTGITNFSQQENSIVHFPVMTAIIDTYLDVEGINAVNSGPYENLVMNASTSCVAGTKAIIARVPGSLHPIDNLTVNFDGCPSTGAQVAVDFESGGDFGPGIHYENTGNTSLSNVFIDVGENSGSVPMTACPVYCPQQVNVSAGAHIHDLAITGTGGAGVNIGSNAATQIETENITVSWTNVIVDNARSCTISSATGDSTITRYDHLYNNGWFGTAQNPANSCGSGGTYVGPISVGGLITATGGISLPSGATETIQSGATLTCAAGSVCPNGLSGLNTDGVLYALNASSATSLTPPTNNGNYVVTYPVSASAAVAPVASLPGVPFDTQSGSTYTIVGSSSGSTSPATDRVSLVQTTNNTTSTAVTVPQAGSTGFGSNFAFLHCNTGSVVATDTPTTSTVNGNATLVLLGAVTGHTSPCAMWWSNNANYLAGMMLPADGNGRLAAEAFPALTGVVTNTAGSLSTTIGAGAITNTMLANSTIPINTVTCTLGTACTVNPVIAVSNATTTGTTVNTLTSLTGAPSTAVIATASATGGVEGITISGAGTSGTATIQKSGPVNCVFSNATTAGDYVQISSTAGDCSDVGSTYPTSGQVIGRVLVSNGTSPATNLIDLFGPEIKASSGGSSTPCTTTANSLQYDNAGAFGCTTPFTFASNTITAAAAGILDMSAATGAPALKLPQGVGGNILAGTVTAANSAPIVIQNTNSSNNNNSITMAVSAPGTSTGQTELNINAASTGGDFADFGTGGTLTAGVLSGQTIIDSFGITGLTKFGAGPAITAGTSGGIGLGCGTAPTGVASNDVLYCDSANQPVALSGTTNLGIIATQSQTAQITSADWSCGTGGTVSSCVSAQTIGTLSFTFPLEVKTWTIDCNLVVGQATGVTANNWNAQTATNGATNSTFTYNQATAAAAVATGATTDQASTTTTFNIGGTWTQGATGTKMPVHIWGTIEGTSASGTVFNLQLVAPTVGDLVTIYRGSSCRYY
jgi:hypothetical protein